jgi:hypothetical protein
LKNRTNGPSVRKYLVARGQEVLGTYTTRRIAIAAAVMHKGTVFSIEGMENCVVRLAMDETFEEAA